MISFNVKNAGIGVVDDCDSDLIMGRIYANKKPRSTYILCVQNSHTQFLHRVIMARILGRPMNRHEFVDHIDGEGMNNIRENLRLCNPQQNSWNKKISANTLTGYKGVSKTKNRIRPYRAMIKVNNTPIYLGSFPTAEAAHAAYCEAAQKYFGEFWRAA